MTPYLISGTWDAARWPNFTLAEIACPCCGEVWVDPAAMNALQAMRDALRMPLKINSGHRCAAHNAKIKGAANSEHLRLAFDVALSGINPRAFHDAAIRAGFYGLGYGEDYLHLDTRAAPVRWHYSDEAATFWAGQLLGHLR